MIACFVTLMPELNAQEAASLSPNVAAIAVHDATSDIGTVKAGSRQVSPRDSVAVEGQRVTARSVVRISVRENGRLLVPVSINGKKECRFLFDTGATISVVSERLATKMGVSVKSTVRVQTFAGAVSLAVGQVDTLQVGNHSIVGSEVLIGDLGRLFNLDPGIEGILGQDLLSRFNYLLNRRGRKLEIEEEGNLASVVSGTRVTFEKRGGKIYVPAAGGALRLMLDSGNPYLVLYEDVAQKLNAVMVNSSGESAVGSSIGRRAIRPSRLPELEIGDSHFRNVEAYLSIRGSGRSEDGFLPLHFFDSIYINNSENFLIANPLSFGDRRHNLEIQSASYLVCQNTLW